MSWYASAWAETAPVADVYERAIITLLAHRSKKDGRASHPPSNPKIARYAMCDEKSVKRRLKAMQERGLIAPGDPAVVAHIEPRYRPNVWDLQIPHSWFSAAQLEEIDRERAEQGEPPLTPESRPDLAAPPSRKRRADAGTSRPRAAADGDDAPVEMPGEEQGGLEVPPAVEGGLSVPPEPGGTTSPGQGGLEVQTRGDYQTPSTSFRGREPSSELKDPPTPRAAGGCSIHGRSRCRECGHGTRAAAVVEASAQRSAERAIARACPRCSEDPVKADVWWVLERKGVPVVPATLCDHAPAGEAQEQARSGPAPSGVDHAPGARVYTRRSAAARARVPA